MENNALARPITPRSLLGFALPTIIMMVFMNLYTMVDGVFVSRIVGTDALSAVNLVFPFLMLVMTIGIMLASGGSAIIARKMGQDRYTEARQNFSMIVFFGILVGVVLSILGLMFRHPLVRMLGADPAVSEYCITYLSALLPFIPTFMLQILFQTFFVTAGKSRMGLAVIVAGGLTNMVLDYVFIFPLDMGLFGAALATGFSPAVSMCVMSIHVWKKKNGFAFCRVKEVAKSGLLFCKLGISAFINEFATGVVLTVFNLLILSITGNTGVAAYGVIANIALVGTAVYTGLSQGTQPLVSQYYGKRDHHSTRKLYGFAISSALLLGAVMIAIAWGFTEPLVSVFNGEGNEALQTMAEEGLRLYFIGFLFAGINIVSAVYLGAVEQPMPSFFIAMTRGVVAILIFAFLLSALFGMLGIWLAFPAAEGATCLLTAVFMWRSRKRENKN